jgi:hypothetical protein
MHECRTCEAKWDPATYLDILPLVGAKRLEKAANEVAMEFGISCTELDAHS